MWRCTVFFATESYTWTESHYLPSGGSVTSVSALLVGLAALRVNMMASNCRIVAIRIENLTPPRTVYYLQAGTYVSVGQFTANVGISLPDTAAAPPFVAVKIRVQGSAGYSTEIYVSGVPEGLIGTGGQSEQNLEPNIAFRNQLQIYVNYLISNQFSFRVRQLPQPLPQCTAPASQPVQAAGLIAVQFGVPLTFGTPPSFGPTPAALVLKGFRRANNRLPGLSGIYKVAAGSPGLTASAAPYIYWLQNTYNVAPSNIIVTGGGCGLTWYYDTYAIMNPRGATHRKRGASALAPRGRSRTRV